MKLFKWTFKSNGLYLFIKNISIVIHLIHENIGRHLRDFHGWSFVYLSTYNTWCILYLSTRIVLYRPTNNWVTIQPAEHLILYATVLSGCTSTFKEEIIKRLLNVTTSYYLSQFNQENVRTVHEWRQPTYNDLTTWLTARSSCLKFADDAASLSRKSPSL